MALSPQQRKEIRATFDAYLKKRATNLRKLRLADMKFNVIQLRATGKMLDLVSPRDLLRYRLAQYLERGAVTAMGRALQQTAKIVSGFGSPVEGADIEIMRNGRRYLVQVKSGPDTANKDIAQNIGALLNAARVRDPSAVCVFGVCYARPEQISPIAKGQLQARGVDLKVGREFWEFVSGDPKCLDEVLEIAGEAGDAVEATMTTAIGEKLAELVREFSARYGATLDSSAWTKFLADNS